MSIYFVLSVKIKDKWQIIIFCVFLIKIRLMMTCVEWRLDPAGRVEFGLPVRARGP